MSASLLSSPAARDASCRQFLYLRNVLECADELEDSYLECVLHERIKVAGVHSVNSQR